MKVRKRFAMEDFAIDTAGRELDCIEPEMTLLRDREKNTTSSTRPNNWTKSNDSTKQEYDIISS